MVNDLFLAHYSSRRRWPFHIAAMVVVIAILLALLPLVFFKWQNSRGNEKAELLQHWDSGSFDKVYTLSKDFLVHKPMDFFLLSIHGFSAYQLAVAQINNFDTITYIDDTIWALRKALLVKEGQNDGRVFYVLGKAYYYKGPGYADLAVTYLEKARAVSYPAADIPEYLGMTYAAIQDYRGSVAAFTEALYPPLSEDSSGNGEKPSSGTKRSGDLLLLAIARSYISMEETNAAKAYLVRCIESSLDSQMIMTARFLLGSIMSRTGDVSGAEDQYLAVIKESGENAEAYYQLGELYAAGGNATRARAQWRKAVQLNPAHNPARRRLNM